MSSKESSSESGMPEARGRRIPIAPGDGRPASLGFIPETFSVRNGTRLAVCVHGISRDHHEQIELLKDEATAHGYALLALHFDEATWSDYQRLGRRGRGSRADIGLDLAIERFEMQLGMRFAERFLIGFSGGAQFVHRYVMAHPGKVRAAVCAASGWYTMPDSTRKYPYGLRVDGALSGVHLEPEEFLRVPVLTAVGSADTTTQALRSTKKLDAQQGPTRLERARRWSEAMARAAESRGLSASHSFVVVDGAGHDFSDCAKRGLDRVAFEFFDCVKGLN